MTSKHLEAFLNFYDKALAEYSLAFEMVNTCDKLTQDLLHKLELENLTTSEKNKVATQLKYCRKDRRYWKDKVEEYEPFVSLFIDIDNNKKTENQVSNNKKCINWLKEALGQIRKQEAYHADRHYKPRIITIENK